ncbi:hypothetical protein AVEN_89070-1 [Araneus ventricosus]|uniref:Uncharacterized protein n=1 Tax=Araneus ventricosus TaxID=182803 RepID=A0A4Y2B1I6_ARAVE|nr:hypothetical protein AVEN_89070-1 [Araneus ventricosus]
MKSNLNVLCERSKNHVGGQSILEGISRSRRKDLHQSRMVIKCTENSGVDFFSFFSSRECWRYAPFYGRYSSMSQISSYRRLVLESGIECAESPSCSPDLNRMEIHWML